MSTCTFFGHRECYGLKREKVLNAIEGLIGQGVDTFYVGNQGAFDAMVYGCLKELQKTYPHIFFRVVLAYLPTRAGEWEDFSDTLYPEGMELVPPKFAVERRNKWMIQQADCSLCYINHTWGGAYKFARLAKRRGLYIFNLGDGLSLDL